MPYRIFIDPGGINDSQHTIDYYDSKQTGPGEKFKTAIEIHFEIISRNPHFRVRHTNIHCLPVKKWPYMIHYSISKKNPVLIHAVIPTNPDPDKYWLNQLNKND